MKTLLLWYSIAHYNNNAVLCIVYLRNCLKFIISTVLDGVMLHTVLDGVMLHTVVDGVMLYRVKYFALKKMDSHLKLRFVWQVEYCKENIR